MSDGRPNLSGIWQVLSEANYDLEPHMARPSMQVRQGPLGPVPVPDVALFLAAKGTDAVK